MMNLEKRIALMVRLGDHLKGTDEYLDALMHRTSFHNQWFTIDNQKKAVQAIATGFLTKERLEEWLAKYDLSEPQKLQTVGIIMAGNIPLVGFHDFLCTFLAGHRSMIKLSDKDPYIFPYLVKLLTQWEEEMRSYVTFTDKLKGFDAVIATGSNNSARYFEAYFGQYPNIIRKNRNGVAVLSGKESREELYELGKDIFSYFGLGCRNVAKVYLPKGYNFEPLMEELHKYNKVVMHSKYKNNFDYNYSLFILNKVPIINNGCIILKEDASLQSRISALHYEFFEDQGLLEAELQRRAPEIQCIVAQDGLLKQQTFQFGQAQQPRLSDYADGLDTMAFLGSLVND